MNWRSAAVWGICYSPGVLVGGWFVVAGVATTNPLPIVAGMFVGLLWIAVITGLSGFEVIE